MMKILKSIGFAAALVLAPLAAAATTLTNSGNISAGDDAYLTDLILNGGTVTYTFTATQRVKIDDFITVAANDSAGGANIPGILFGLNGDVTHSFTTITVNGTTANATEFLSGFILEAGESFTFTWDNDTNGIGTVNTLVNFTVSAVPLPAGGLLLISAFGVAAVARRRKAA